MTDERYEELNSPMPSLDVRSLRDDPNYIKCPRCWHYTHEGFHNPDNLCDRCCTALVDGWPNDPIVPKIMESRIKQLEHWRARGSA